MKRSPTVHTGLFTHGGGAGGGAGAAAAGTPASGPSAATQKHVHWAPTVPDDATIAATQAERTKPLLAKLDTLEKAYSESRAKLKGNIHKTEAALELCTQAIRELEQTIQQKVSEHRRAALQAEGLKLAAVKPKPETPAPAMPPYLKDIMRANQGALQLGQASRLSATVNILSGRTHDSLQCKALLAKQKAFFTLKLDQLKLVLNEVRELLFKARLQKATLTKTLEQMDVTKVTSRSTALSLKRSVAVLPPGVPNLRVPLRATPSTSRRAQAGS